MHPSDTDFPVGPTASVGGNGSLSGSPEGVSVRELVTLADLAKRHPTLAATFRSLVDSGAIRKAGVRSDGTPVYSAGLMLTAAQTEAAEQRIAQTGESIAADPRRRARQYAAATAQARDERKTPTCPWEAGLRLMGG